LESTIGQHEDFAKFALTAAVISGVAALISLLYIRFRSSGDALGRLLTIVTLAFSIATVGAMSWTAKLGGVIRHTEISASGGQAQPVDVKKEDRRKDDDD
jgi:hypothetical protein